MGVSIRTALEGAIDNQDVATAHVIAGGHDPEKATALGILDAVIALVLVERRRLKLELEHARGRDKRDAILESMAEAVKVARADLAPDRAAQLATANELMQSACVMLVTGSSPERLQEWSASVADWQRESGVPSWPVVAPADRRSHPREVVPGVELEGPR